MRMHAVFRFCDTGKYAMTVVSIIFLSEYANFIRGIFSYGNGISLSEIRDMIQNDSNIKISSKEIFGDSIQFCDPERKNESLLVYPSEVNAENVINTLRNTDIVSEAAKMTL